MWKTIVIILMCIIDTQVTCLKYYNKSIGNKKVSMQLLPFFRRQVEQDLETSSQIKEENEFYNRNQKFLNFMLQNAKDILKTVDEDEVQEHTTTNLKTVLNPTNIKNVLDHLELIPREKNKYDEAKLSLLLNTSQIADNDNVLINNDSLEMFHDQNNGPQIEDAMFLQAKLQNDAKLRRKLNNIANVILSNRKYIRDVAESGSWNVSNIPIDITLSDQKGDFSNKGSTTRIDLEHDTIENAYALFRQEMENRNESILSDSFGNERIHNLDLKTVPANKHTNIFFEDKTVNHQDDPAASVTNEKNTLPYLVNRLKESNNKKNNYFMKNRKVDVVSNPNYASAVNFTSQIENSIPYSVNSLEDLHVNKKDNNVINNKEDVVSNEQYKTQEMSFQLNPADENYAKSYTLQFHVKSTPPNLQNVSISKFKFLKNIGELEQTPKQTDLKNYTKFDDKGNATITANNISDVVYESFTDYVKIKAEPDLIFVTQNLQRSCITCDNVADDWCSSPKNKLVRSSLCEKANDLCYSLHTPFGIVDRGCYNRNWMSYYVCGCNMCNYIHFTDLPIKFISKKAWIQNFYEISRLRNLRKTTNTNISCLNCTVNATVIGNAFQETNCIEGDLTHVNTTICKQDEICGIRVIKSQGYIWRGCIKFPKYNYYMTFCNSDLCNYDSVASLYDKTD